MVLEGADAAFAEDHVWVAGGEDVLGGLEVFIDRHRHAALEQHRLSRPGDGLEQREVLHAARSDLHQIGELGDARRVLGRHHLGDDAHAVRVGRGAHPMERGVAVAVEGIRGGARLERAASQEGDAARAQAVRDFPHLALGLDRAGTRHDDRRGARADVDAGDGHDARLGIDARMHGRGDGHPGHSLDGQQRRALDGARVLLDEEQHGGLRPR